MKKNYIKLILFVILIVCSLVFISCEEEDEPIPEDLAKIVLLKPNYVWIWEMVESGIFNKLWIKLQLVHRINSSNDYDVFRDYSGKVGEHFPGMTIFNNIVDDEETQKQDVFPATSSDVYKHQVILSSEDDPVNPDPVQFGKVLNIRDQKINKISTLVNFNNSLLLTKVSVDIYEYVVSDMGSFTGSTYRYEFTGGVNHKIYGVPVSDAELRPVSKFETFKKRINIVIIPGQGYYRNNQSLFHTRAMDVIGYFNTPEYPVIRDYLDKFNFIIWERKLDSTHPLGNQFGLVNHSYLNGLYLEDGSGNKLEKTDVDQIILLTKNEKTKAYGLPWLAPTDDDERFSYTNIKNYEEQAILHELGHSFCGMHDEYSKNKLIPWGYYAMKPYLYNAIKVTNNLNGEHFKFVEEVWKNNQWVTEEDKIVEDWWFEKDVLKFWADLYYTGYNWISFNRGAVYISNGIVRPTLAGLMRYGFIDYDIYANWMTPIHGYNYSIQLYNRTNSAKRSVDNYFVEDFKREYPPYLKWGGKYISINKPTVENTYSSTNQIIEVNYDWCYSNLPAGKYKFEISLYTLQDHNTVLAPSITDNNSYTIKDEFPIEEDKDFLYAFYKSGNFNWNISSILTDTDIQTRDDYQIKIEIVEENNGLEEKFKKVYTAFSQPFTIIKTN